MVCMMQAADTEMPRSFLITNKRYVTSSSWLSACQRDEYNEEQHVTRAASSVDNETGDTHIIIISVIRPCNSSARPDIATTLATFQWHVFMCYT